MECQQSLLLMSLRIFRHLDHLEIGYYFKKIMGGVNSYYWLFYTQAYLPVTVTVMDFNDPPMFPQDEMTLSILEVWSYC